MELVIRSFAITSFYNYLCKSSTYKKAITDAVQEVVELGYIHNLKKERKSQKYMYSSLSADKLPLSFDRQNLEQRYWTFKHK